MKKFIRFILIGIIIFSGYTTATKNESDVEKSSEKSYLKFISELFDSLENMSDDEINAFENPDYLEYYKLIFDNEITKIEFETIVEDKDGRKTYSGLIYYKNGYFFMKHDGEIEEPHGVTSYNYVTKKDKVYAWISGNKEGKTFIREEGDTESFLLYCIDVSAIMRSFYWTLKRNPNDFNLDINEGKVKAELKTPYYGFKGIAFYNKPLWLSEILLEDNDREILFRVKKPVEVKEIPKEYKSIPENMKWKELDYSLIENEVYI